MANVIVFPDHDSFTGSLRFTSIEGVAAEPLYPPHFCEGIVEAAVLVTSGLDMFLGRLEEQGIATSGVIPYLPTIPDVPDEGPPDSVWLEIMGGVTIEKVERSLSDPQRIRAEARLKKDCGHLIPVMARIIRGGAFAPMTPALTFEEEHRLITIFPDSFGFCRINDIYDLWTMMRTTVELFIEAWERKDGLKPEESPRQGIGAVEIFKRLPGTNCGECGDPGCMEFASGLLMNRCRLKQCKPLFEPEFSRHLSSMTWLLKGIGVGLETPSAGKETPAP